MARRGDACIVVIDVDDIVLHDNITQVKLMIFSSTFTHIRMTNSKDRIQGFSSTN